VELTKTYTVSAEGKYYAHIYTANYTRHNSPISAAKEHQDYRQRSKIREHERV